MNNTLGKLKSKLDGIVGDSGGKGRGKPQNNAGGNGHYGADIATEDVLVTEEEPDDLSASQQYAPTTHNRKYAQGKPVRPQRATINAITEESLDPFDKVNLLDAKLDTGCAYLERILRVFTTQVDKVNATITASLTGLGREAENSAKELKSELYREWSFWLGLLFDSADTAIGLGVIFSWFIITTPLVWVACAFAGFAMSVIIVDTHIGNEMLNPNEPPPGFLEIMKKNSDEINFDKALGVRKSFLTNIEFFLSVVGLVLGVGVTIYQNVADKVMGVLLGIATGCIILLINYAFKKNIKNRARTRFMEINYKVIHIWNLRVFFEKAKNSAINVEKTLDKFGEWLRDNLLPKDSSFFDQK